MRPLSLVLCMALGLGGAFSALAQDYPAREVDRPLLMTRGLMEMDAEVFSFSAQSVWDNHGDLVDAPGTYQLTQIGVQLKYGILDSLQLALDLPYLTGHIHQAEGSGFGDVAGEVGLRFLHRPELLETAALFRVSYPTGLHDHSHDIINTELVQTDWITGDPGWDLYPGLAAKLFRKNWALEGRGEYWFRLQGEVAQDVLLFSGTANLDPGDGFFLQAAGLYQVLDWLVLRAGVEYTSLAQDVLDHDKLGNDSQLLLAKPSVLIQFNREFDAYGGFGYTVLGKNTGYGFPWFFGIRARF